MLTTFCCLAIGTSLLDSSTTRAVISKLCSPTEASFLASLNACCFFITQSHLLLVLSIELLRFNASAPQSDVACAVKISITAPIVDIFTFSARIFGHLVANHFNIAESLLLQL